MDGKVADLNKRINNHVLVLISIPAFGEAKVFC